MVEEINNSIKATLYERTKSPLFGAFIFSWCIWNWQPIYYILTVDSKIPFETRLNCLLNYGSLTTQVWGPIGSIFIYYLISYINVYFYQFELYLKKMRVELKQQSELKQLLTLEQSNKIRQDIKSIEEKSEKIIIEKEKEINEIQSKYYGANGKIDALNKEVDEFKYNLTSKINENEKLNSELTEFKILRNQTIDKLEQENDKLIQENNNYNGELINFSQENEILIITINSIFELRKNNILEKFLNLAKIISDNNGIVTNEFISDKEELIKKYNNLIGKDVNGRYYLTKIGSKIFDFSK